MAPSAWASGSWGPPGLSGWSRCLRSVLGRPRAAGRAALSWRLRTSWAKGVAELSQWTGQCPGGSGLTLPAKETSSEVRCCQQTQQEASHLPSPSCNSSFKTKHNNTFGKRAEPNPKAWPYGWNSRPLADGERLPHHSTWHSSPWGTDGADSAPTPQTPLAFLLRKNSRKASNPSLRLAGTQRFSTSSSHL